MHNSVWHLQDLYTSFYCVCVCVYDIEIQVVFFLFILVVVVFRGARLLIHAHAFIIYHIFEDSNSAGVRVFRWNNICLCVCKLCLQMMQTKCVYSLSSFLVWLILFVIYYSYECVLSALRIPRFTLLLMFLKVRI